MVPAAVIEVDSLPMTVNGKLDVKALPSADDVLGRSGGARTEPRTDTERVLSGLFGEILASPPPGSTTTSSTSAVTRCWPPG